MRSKACFVIGSTKSARTAVKPHRNRFPRTEDKGWVMGWVGDEGWVMERESRSLYLQVFVTRDSDIMRPYKQ